ncbi:hypothetical protein [Bosea sp. BIWAKO-01]|uniref:hypothetical protein n=1 Tax=Bosea sp. BIWAKO-01 TaxID=506668 RepID=UPI000852D895|nr:hypothetical protein [Bosea sp. BIWAKO-01]GAU84172.1 hypothetical protein BIWAKO_04104 [Bosea sp. BIWAKO-01]
MTWAVSAIVSVVLIASATSAIVGGTARLGASAASGLGSVVSGAASQVAGRLDLSSLDPSAYVTDTLFRLSRASFASAWTQ